MMHRTIENLSDNASIWLHLFSFSLSLLFTDEQNFKKKTKGKTLLLYIVVVNVSAG